MGLALLLAGCGGGALRHSFNDYSAVYADSMNRQLLLNLARMSESHPPRFLQLGLINSTFSFGSTASASMTGTSTEGLAPTTSLPPFRLLSQIWTSVFGLTANVTETPTFSMTPLAGPQFAQGFLASVPTQVFFTLLEQGEPIDQLLRILVQSIEFTYADNTKGVLIVNEPSVDRPQQWAEFLRLTGILLELQKRHLLSVTTTVIPNPPSGPTFTAPTIDQALKATEKGMILTEVSPGKFGLTTFTPATSLHIDPAAGEIFAELGKQPYFQLGTLARAGGKTPTGLTLRLRSFFSVLSWVSFEQKVYDVIAAQPGFLASIPPSQHHPVIRITWDDVAAESMVRPLIEVSYMGRKYAVTDRVGNTWNRDVFTLLSYIESQISLDPKSLPVQQLINVR